MWGREKGAVFWGVRTKAECRPICIAAAQAIGAELDLTDKGLGIRSRRYTLLAEDGVVRS